MILRPRGRAADAQRADLQSRARGFTHPATPRSWNWRAWRSRSRITYGLPMDMEWAKDGITDELYIVQARPETVPIFFRANPAIVLQSYTVTPAGPKVLEGLSVGNAGRRRGEPCLPHPLRPADIDKFRRWFVLVTLDHRSRLGCRS